MTQDTIKALAAGKVVQFRPKGNSMRPYIESGALVTVKPTNDDTSLQELETGDIVFCKVKGQNFVHLIKAIVDEDKFLIANATGKENGYATKIYGKVIQVQK